MTWIRSVENSEAMLEMVVKSLGYDDALVRVEDQDVKVGKNEYAHIIEANTTKNQDRVWFTARLQIKQVMSAIR